MSMPSFSLEGQLAVVTGGGTGIGRGIALAFAKAGADVVVASRRLSVLEKVSEEVAALGKRSLAIQTDITKRADVDNLVQKVMDEFGAIDILVNNAGVGDTRTSIEISPEEWQRVFDINFKGCLLCSQAVIKGMIERNRGNIINISSGAGLKGNSGPYGIAKAAILRLTGGLALDLARYNIRVNAICPAWIRSEMTRRVWSNPEILKHCEDRVPLGHRIAEVDELIGTALYFASDASSFVTGQYIAVDGGREAAGDYYLAFGTLDR